VMILWREGLGRSAEKVQKEWCSMLQMLAAGARSLAARQPLDGDARRGRDNKLGR